MWIGPLAAAQVTFVSGHRYRIDFESPSGLLNDPSTAAQIVTSWSDVISPDVQGKFTLASMISNTATSKADLVDYTGQNFTATLPTLPQGVTLTITDQGPSNPQPSTGSSAGVVILGAAAVVAIGVLAYVVATER